MLKLLYYKHDLACVLHLHAEKEKTSSMLVGQFVFNSLMFSSLSYWDQYLQELVQQLEIFLLCWYL